MLGPAGLHCDDVLPKTLGGIYSQFPFLPNSFLFVGDQVYQGNPMEFSPYGEVTGELVDGGMCLPSDTPGDWTGKVVLCEHRRLTPAFPAEH